MKPYLIPAEDGFGNPFDEEKHYYKIYNDGGHYMIPKSIRRKVLERSFVSVFLIYIRVEVGSIWAYLKWAERMERCIFMR